MSANKLRKWHYEILQIRMGLRVKPNEGCLWSGLDSHSEKGPVRARRLAQQRELTTLEMTDVGRDFDATGYYGKKLVEDFGPDWGAEKKAIFGLLSQGWARKMSGHVSVLIGQGSTKIELLAAGSRELKEAASPAGDSEKDPIIPAFVDAASGERYFMTERNLSSVENKILLDELMDLDISEPLTSSGNVTSVSVTEVNEKDQPVSTYMMPISKHNN